MNKRDIFLSITVHFVLLFSALITSPFEPTSQIDYGEVIRVSLPSANQIPSKPKELPPEPVAIPKPQMDDEPDIPINAPETQPAAEIEKPKPEPEKPKPKPDKPKQKLPDPKDADRGDNDQQGSTDSDVETSTSDGSVLGGATVDNSSFVYPYWFTLSKSKIAKFFRNPVNYDGTLKCVVYYEVMQSGRIYGLKVIESSGVPRFDQACLSAIERSAPFPPLPKEFLSEVIGITQPFIGNPR